MLLIDRFTSNDKNIVNENISISGTLELRINY